LIIWRFVVPHNIITDNGSNFTAEEFQDFCEKLEIQLKYASVAHPQINGQVEKAKDLVTSNIKKWLMMPLKRAVRAWLEELPSVLWSLRTTPKRSTQYMLFLMVHDAEVVLPSDVRHNAP
jgi:transposase InsO family protein